MADPRLLLETKSYRVVAPEGREVSGARYLNGPLVIEAAGTDALGGRIWGEVFRVDPRRADSGRGTTPGPQFVLARLLAELSGARDCNWGWRAGPVEVRAEKAEDRERDYAWPAG